MYLVADIMTELAALSVKNTLYLIDDDDKNKKKSKAQKSVRYYKNLNLIIMKLSRVTQFENEKNYL